MKSEQAMARGRDRLRQRIAASLCCLALAGCATQQAAPARQRADAHVAEAALNYYQSLTRMSTGELARERTALAALPNNANTQVRTAMLLGLARGPQDLGRAITLLEAVLKSSDPAAIALHPLARLLAENYTERQKLDAQGERLLAQAQDGQRRANELQEKIDRLTEIERTLPSRSTKAAPPGAAR
ncbi:MAG TPA: permease [Rhodocyclaceae bacterium]|nr:permease [Rhodocyclaceae bacterium]